MKRFLILEWIQGEAPVPKLDSGRPGAIKRYVGTKPKHDAPEDAKLVDRLVPCETVEPDDRMFRKAVSKGHLKLVKVVQAKNIGDALKSLNRGPAPKKDSK